MRALFVLFIAWLCGPAHAAFSGQIVDAAFVAKAVARGAILWDVRSPEKYFDGRLPGAVNIGHAARALVDEKTNRFPPIEVIAARLSDAGIDGVRASMTAAILTRLGFRSVRVYQGSWLEYGNQPDALVE